MRPDPGPRYYKFSESTNITLKTLAEHERRPEHQLAQDIIAAGLSHYYAPEESRKKWDTLSARQKDVAALVCLGYTNAEVATRLVVSPETVKTHLSQVLRKFEVMSRYQLRDMLSEWNFSAWEK